MVNIILMVQVYGTAHVPAQLRRKPNFVCMTVFSYVWPHIATARTVAHVCGQRESDTCAGNSTARNTSTQAHTNKHTRIARPTCASFPHYMTNSI